MISGVASMVALYTFSAGFHAKFFPKRRRFNMAVAKTASASAATEWRKKVAHGETVGLVVK
jgi:hypothetical protein